MKRVPSFLALAVLTASALAPLSARALQPPKLTARVNDYAQIIDGGTRASLERELTAYEQRTGHQIAVLTVPSLEGDPIEDFSIRVAEAWKIGSADRDDGLILIVAAQDRKMRIEVGYGLEGAVPDALAGRVIQDVIAPRFRTGDFSGGIQEGLRVLMKAAAGEATGLPTSSGPGAGGSQSPAPQFLGILLLILFFGRLLLWKANRLLRFPILGVLGAVVGFVATRSVEVAMQFGFVGLFVAMITDRYGRGLLWFILLSSGGGGRGGGGGGGGFSGGGGSFGGGGASGSW